MEDCVFISEVDQSNAHAGFRMSQALLSTLQQRRTSGIDCRDPSELLFKSGKREHELKIGTDDMTALLEDWKHFVN